ncbi:MAG: DUF4911 domain-containing protein [Deltaproteobacteria bacterium]
MKLPRAEGRVKCGGSDDCIPLDPHVVSSSPSMAAKRPCRDRLMTITARIDPSAVHFLKFVLEGYDNLFLLTTLDRKAGLVLIRYAEGALADLLWILESLRERIGLVSSLPLFELEKGGQEAIS